MQTSKNKKRFNTSNKLFLLIMCVVMTIATIIVSVLLTVRSVSGLRSVLWNHMESVANTAAMLIDGDELELITEADAPELDADGKRISDGSARYSNIENVLRQVKDSQKDMHIAFIYIARNEDGHFVFIVDTDTDTPAEYGEEVIYTPSQPIAWSGKSKVDDEPYEDKWGKYYTAWSPVNNADGKVVGIVGVDFEASEITEQIRYSIALIIISTAVLLTLNIAFFVFYSLNSQKYTKQLSNEITDLSDNLKTMFDEIEGIETTGESQEETDNDTERDFIEYVHEKTIAMTQRLHEHTAYMTRQANLDFMTKVGNTRAYSADKEKLQAEIDNGTADFAVAVFDINDLKEINDNFGHENGDLIIKSAAEVLKKSFKGYNIYRIGGDEFSVILPATTKESIEVLFKLVDVETERVNKKLNKSITLSMSKGYTIYNPEKDKEFKDVFVRADNNMYEKKEIFHRSRNKDTR